jgi:hypothetical protein
MDDDGMLAEAGVLIGVRTCGDDWKGVGLASTDGVEVACPLLCTADSGGIWHAESSKHMQIKAMTNVRWFIYRFTTIVFTSLECIP